MSTYYEILGLPNNATTEQISEALQDEEKKLSLTLSQADESKRTEAKKQITLFASIEKILLDPKARAEYDAKLAATVMSPFDALNRSDHAVDELVLQFQTMVQKGQIEEGLGLIENAVAKNPNDTIYQNCLALAYQEVAFIPWVSKDGSNIMHAISYDQAVHARTMVERALALKLDNQELRASLEKDRKIVDDVFKYQYCGATVQPAIAFALGLFAWHSGEDVGMALWLILGSLLYVISCFLPSYTVNREFHENRDGSERYDNFGWVKPMMDKLPDNLFGMFGKFCLFAIVIAIIPVFGIYNLYQFHRDSIQRWIQAQLDGTGALSRLVKK